MRARTATAPEAANYVDSLYSFAYFPKDEDPIVIFA